MALIRGNGGLNIRFYFHDPEKNYPWFWRVLCRNPSNGLICSELQEPPKTGKKLAE